MAHYILQTLAFQLLFLLIYDLFLKRETFFNYNRLYLLLTPVLSLILPFVKLDFIQQRIPEEYIIQLPAVLIGNTTSKEIVSSEIVSNSISAFTIVQWVWIAGMSIAIVIFIYKIFKILQMKKKGSLIKIDGTTVIELPNTDLAFTFLKTIYLGEQLSEAQKKQILLHEKVHVKEHHFADLLFFEAMRIVFWFNPLVYVFQNRIAVLQEFKADAIVSKQQEKRAYYQNLLSQVFQVEDISFINTFFKHSLIKKRIVMLQKSKSKKIFQLKYLALIPVVCGMLIYSSCANESAEVEVTSSDTEVMDKINELAEAIMKKGNISDEEVRAIKFLGMEAKEGDRIYTSVQEYLDETANMEEIIEQEYIDPNDPRVSFKELTEFPVFPGCESADGDEKQKKCFQQGVTTHIMKNFNIKIANDVGLSGRQKIMVSFTISKNGNVTEIKSRAPHPSLEAEGRRVVASLPKITPGQVDGENVNVIYTVPIAFDINE